MPFNSIFSWIIKKRLHQIDLFRKHPAEVQNDVLMHLVTAAQNTEWGKKYGYKDISSISDYQKNVPLQDYEQLQPYVDRLIKNEQNLLWNTDIKMFAKSSGTTSGKSKFIPVSNEAVAECHYKGGKDLLSLYYHNFPDRKLYNGKHLIVGGSAQINMLSANSYIGDLSSIIIKNLPFWAEIRRTPKRKIALMSDWEDKIDKMAESTLKEDVYILAGVPSWTLVLMNKVLELSGKDKITDVWPNLELYMHGGVNFAPYKAQFDKIIGNPNMNYVETYNASEGFFGIQDQVNSNEMLLMLDYGIFYEFIPMDKFDHINSKEVVGLKDVEVGKNYALVISTNSGLWRYIIGDTVMFTSKEPYRFKITGRTKHFINAFGEELIVENVEKAIGIACSRTNSEVQEYTVAPVYMDAEGKNGKHEWLVEFSKEPENLAQFTEILDNALKSVNTDYEAKRTGNLTLDLPDVQKMPVGTFYEWLKSKNKLGGQHKIPRLSNNRELIEEVLQLSVLKKAKSIINE